MKKRAWLIPVFAIAMAAIASMSAWAEEGWKQENSNWVYYNSSGSKVYDTWKKGADDKWRYLNSQGEMATDAWVDNDDYYVDEDGIMVSGKWLKITDRDDNTNWHYFDAKGKAVQEKWLKIDNKWYYFDEDGVMLTGWILDDMYFCGEDGVMKTGWQKLNDPNDDDDDDNDGPFIGSSNDDSDDVHWYYFSSSNGKKYVPELNGSEYGERKVDGKRYCFDEKGAMQTGWVNVETGDTSSDIRDYKYYNEDGSVRTGWYSIEPPDDIMANYEDDVMWFYFSSKGVPKAAEDSNYNTGDIEKISGKSYLFDENGNPIYGLQKIFIGSSETEYTSFYFGDKNQCSMQTGKTSVTEGDGNRTTYYFLSSGRGYTGVHDGYLYYKGKVQKADSDSKYEVYRVDGANYLVGTQGRIEKKKTVKDKDGVKYTTTSAGTVSEIDGEAVGSGYTGQAPEEPVFEEE